MHVFRAHYRGIQASFVVANDAAAGFDVGAYQNKTTEELIAELTK